MGIFTLPQHIDLLSLIHNVNYILQELLPCPYLWCLLLEFVCTCGDCMVLLSFTGLCPFYSSIIETWSSVVSSHWLHVPIGHFFLDFFDVIFLIIDALVFILFGNLLDGMFCTLCLQCSSSPVFPNLSTIWCLSLILENSQSWLLQIFLYCVFLFLYFNYM